MKKLEFQNEAIHLTKTLVDNDVLGDFLKNDISQKHASEKLHQLAGLAKMNFNDYFLLQSFFYIIDASSYPGLHNLVFRREESGQLFVKNGNFYGLNKT